MLLLFFTPALHGGLGLDTGAKKTKAKKTLHKAALRIKRGGQCLQRNASLHFIGLVTRHGQIGFGFV